MTRSEQRPTRSRRRSRDTDESDSDDSTDGTQRSSESRSRPAGRKTRTSRTSRSSTEDTGDESEADARDESVADDDAEPEGVDAEPENVDDGAEEEEVEDTDEADTDGADTDGADDVSESEGSEKPRRRRMPARKIARAAAEQVEEMTGKPSESVTSVRRDEDSWYVGLEVIEASRIPSTTDILATYEAEMDEDGELISYRRTHRYVRGRGDEE